MTINNISIDISII